MAVEWREETADRRLSMVAQWKETKERVPRYDKGPVWRMREGVINDGEKTGHTVRLGRTGRPTNTAARIKNNQTAAYS